MVPSQAPRSDYRRGAKQFVGILSQLWSALRDYLLIDRHLPGLEVCLQLESIFQQSLHHHLHLVHARRVDPLGLQEAGGIQVAGADGLDLPGELLGIIGLGIEPVAAAMRLEFGRFLKSDRPVGARSSRRSLA